MKVKKLDKRFRLAKAGVATHYADFEGYEYLTKIEKLMIASFGTGAPIANHNRFVSQYANLDWFYSSKKAMIDSYDRISTAKNGQPVYSHRRKEGYIYRIYFRREEQATMLALKLSQ